MPEILDVNAEELDKEDQKIIEESKKRERKQTNMTEEDDVDKESNNNDVHIIENDEYEEL